MTSEAREAPMFTAATFASALGRKRQSLQRQLAGTTPAGQVVVGGNFANAWRIEDIPADLRESLESRQHLLGYPDVAQMLLRGPAKWTPPVSIGQIATADLEGARKRRDVLAPLLRDHGEQSSTAELVQMAQVRFALIGQDQVPAGGTIRRWFDLARRRDRGEGDWERVEIYLLDEAFRGAGAKSPKEVAVEFEELAAVIGALPAEDSTANKDRALPVWKAAFQELAWVRSKGGSEKEAKRKIIDFIYVLCPWMAESREAFRRNFNRKWSAWAEAGGDAEALKDGRQSGRVGRRALALLTPDQVKKVQEMAVRMDACDPTKTNRFDVSLALRLFAQSEECPEELSEIILKKRKSKHTITPALKRQVRVSQATRQFHRGNKTFGLHAMYQPRDLFWIDAEGRERPIMPGNLFEADDAHFNEPFYVDWEDARDKCAAKFGVRLFRAQLIAWIDVGSARFVAYSIVLRYNDAYRAKDICWSVCHLFESVGIPTMDDGAPGVLRLEGGVWNAKIISALEQSHGLVGILHTRNAHGKPLIENRFNQLQKYLSLMGASVGRRRGEMERESKKWTACREGRMDPRKSGFLSLEELTKKVDAAFVALNGEPMEGEIYGRKNAEKLHGRPQWIPDEIWSLAPKTLRPPKPDEIYRVMPEQRELTIRKGWAKCKIAEHDAIFHFHDDSFAKLGDGYKVIACFDPARPDLGCAILNNEESSRSAERERGSRYGRAELICIAEVADRVPQFSAARSWDNGESIARTKRFRQQCRMLYREIMPFGFGPGASGAESRNDRGDVASVRSGGMPPTFPDVNNKGKVSVQTDRKKRAEQLLENGTGENPASPRIKTPLEKDNEYDELMKERPDLRPPEKPVRRRLRTITEMLADDEL